MVFFSQCHTVTFLGVVVFFTAPLRITIWISWVPGIMLSKTLMESWAVNFQRIRRGGDAICWLCRCMMMCLTIGYAVYSIHCITQKFCHVHAEHGTHMENDDSNAIFGAPYLISRQTGGLRCSVICRAFALISVPTDQTCFFRLFFLLNAKPQKESSKPLFVSLNPVVSYSLFLRALTTIVCHIHVALPSSFACIGATLAFLGVFVVGMGFQIQPGAIPQWQPKRSW